MWCFPMCRFFVAALRCVLHSGDVPAGCLPLGAMYVTSWDASLRISASACWPKRVSSCRVAHGLTAHLNLNAFIAAQA